MSLLLILLAILAYLLLPFSMEGMTLFGLALLIAIFGLMTGPVAVLSMTLLFYFLLGSILFWTYLTKTSFIDMYMPHIYLVYWTIGILLISLVSGRITSLINDASHYNQTLENQIRTLVAVDPVTGFDNEQRMLTELELEFNRSKRYGTPFSLLVMRINHLDQFERLYGSDEYERLLQHMSEKIFGILRMSDLKFRMDDNMLAFLLTNTPSEHTEIVVNKIKDEISTFQLTNKKYINLSIRFGCSGFPSEAKNFIEVLDSAKEQVDFDET